MLRYVEQAGLVAPARSASGYRLYGAAELQRLRTLKELLTRFDVALSDVAFAARMSSDAGLREAVQGWLAAQPRRPERRRAPRTGCASSRTSTRGCWRPSPEPAAIGARPDALTPRREHTEETMSTTAAKTDYKVADLSWPASAARRSTSPSTRCPA